MNIEESNHNKLLWNSFLSEGSDNSLSELYNYYVDKLYSYGIYLGFNSEMCKDAIQDVFIKLHTTRFKLGQLSSPSSFLFRSFKNRLIDLSRRNRNEIDFDISQISFAIDITILDAIVDKERAVILKEKLDIMLNKLSENQREIIYLRYIDGMTYVDISNKLNIKEDSARKLTYRAIKELRAQASSELPNTTLVVALFKLLNK